MIELPLHIQQIVVVAITIIIVALLLWDKIKPSYVFFTSVLIFLLLGIIKVKSFLSAISNEAIISIFLLIFITAAIQKHLDVYKKLDKILGNTSNPNIFNLKLATIVTGFSAVLNNTPIVAFFMPYIYQWSKKNNVSASKFLLPLSFSAISGGMITVIGTSTNLVLNGLIIAKDAPPLGFLDYLWPGLLVSIAGIAFIYFFAFKLLPNNQDLLHEVQNESREYLVQAKVGPYSKLIGKTITDANLRNLTGLYLFEIVRSNEVITPVNPDEKLHSGDSLFFAGDTKNILELLEKEKELSLPTSSDTLRTVGNFNLVETVIPINSELDGKTLKELEFRENYDAAVVAIHRNGENLRGKLGEIRLNAGDLILLSPGKLFKKNIQEKNVLYLVSEHIAGEQTNKNVLRGFGLVFLLSVMGIITGLFNLFIALLLITGYLVMSNLLTMSDLKKNLDLDLLIILASSLTFSDAIIDTGTATLLANKFLGIFKAIGPAGIIIGIYLVTLILTSIITHVATVSIVFPIAFALAKETPDIAMSAFFLAIAFAASASFHAPFSYQTNLMVYGPGGYKISDYFRIGLPYTIIYSIITLAFILLNYNIL